MKDTIDEAAPGSGKTYSAQRRMIAFPAKYLFVAERNGSIRTITTECLKLAEQSGKHVVVYPLISNETHIASITGIREGVEFLPNQFRDDPHVIAVISHAGLLMAALGDFAGWHIIVDEIPAVLTVQELQTYNDAAFFAEHYALAPLAGFEAESWWRSAALMPLRSPRSSIVAPK